jgi:hypothetical protein
VIKYLYGLDTNYVYEIGMRKEAVGSGNLQLVAYLVEKGIDSWHPELFEDAAEYLSDCLTIAAAQVSSCYVPHVHISRLRCARTRLHTASCLRW